MIVVRNISVMEGQTVHPNEYAVIPGEDNKGGFSKSWLL